MRSVTSVLGILTRTAPAALAASGLLLGLNACGSSSGDAGSQPLVCDVAKVDSFEGTSFESSANFDSQGEALITSNRLAANRLAANKLAVNRLAANRLAANRLAANKLAVNRLAANKLATNKLAANKLATNKLAANKLATNRIAVNRLAANKLATNRITLNQLDVEALGLTEIMQSADDREFLKYLFECALPEDTVLELPLPVDTAEPAVAATVDFAGSIGLAAGWLEAPLSLTQRRWVSACLLSRVNAFGVSVEISMRGPNAALDADAAEAAEWSLQEGAFFGDLFSDPDSPLLGYACRAPRIAGVASESLEQRVCTEPDPENPGFTRCGLVYVGECAAMGGSATAAVAVCKARTSTGEFTGCLPPDAEDLTPASCPFPGESAYPEVITTYLKR